jgi:hypothetical protein
MKSLKAAAMIAGSLIAVSAAGPAFADPAAPGSPGVGGLTGALSKNSPVALDNLQHQENLLNSEAKGSPLHTVNQASDALNSKKLLGGLPVVNSR